MSGSCLLKQHRSKASKEATTGKPLLLNTEEPPAMYHEVKWSEVAQSCLTLCDPMDCSLSGPSIHGIFQARVLEWIAISFSRGSSRTQGSNPGLPHCRQTLYCLSHQGSPIRPLKCNQKSIIKLESWFYWIQCIYLTDLVFSSIFHYHLGKPQNMSTC